MIYKSKHFYGYSRVISISVSAVTASSTTELALFAAPFPLKIKKCSIITHTAITGANTDYQTLGFKNKGAGGSGTSVIASKAFTLGVDTVALDETDLGTCSNNLLTTGDTVTFYKAEASSGADMPALLAQVRFVRY